MTVTTVTLEFFGGPWDGRKLTYPYGPPGNEWSTLPAAEEFFEAGYWVEDPIDDRMEAWMLEPVF